MKFLLDENISSFFIEKIKGRYPGSAGIYDIGYERKRDIEIYKFLKNHKYILITFDLDFTDIRKLPRNLLPGLLCCDLKIEKSRTPLQIP